jgi:hypothetical protein
MVSPRSDVVATTEISKSTIVKFRMIRRLSDFRPEKCKLRPRCVVRYCVFGRPLCLPEFG